MTTFADLLIEERGQVGWKKYAELMLRHQYRTYEPRETDAAHDIYDSHGTYNREADSMGEWADMVAIRLTAGLLHRDFGRRIVLYKPVYNEQHAVTAAGAQHAPAISEDRQSEGVLIRTLCCRD